MQNQDQFTHPKLWQFALGLAIMFTIFMTAFMVIPDNRLPPEPQANSDKNSL
jgi:hypothetical protein